LLPVGFTAGAITTDVNPQRLLGAAFQPLVSLAVAVILYDAGISLDLRKLRGHTRRVVVRLIAVGVPVTLVFGAVFAGLLLGVSRQAAVMTGTILVVSGPTVVGPLLGFIRPTERLQRVLSWEGSLIDPVGGILGAVVFHAVVASTRRGLGYQLGQFLLGISVGLAGGIVGIALLWLLLRQRRADLRAARRRRGSQNLGRRQPAVPGPGRRQARRRHPVRSAGTRGRGHHGPAQAGPF
jgi:NhaP-type Na+/H+ or K+/H+ antiporter